MLVVLNRYKIVFIILSLILFILLLWMLITGQGQNKKPSRGVFVLDRAVEEEWTGGDRL